MFNTSRFRSESLSSLNIFPEDIFTKKSLQSDYSYPLYPESYDDFIPKFAGRGKQTTVMLSDFWSVMNALVEENSRESLNSFTQTIESLLENELIPVRISNNPKDRMLVNPWYIFVDFVKNVNGEYSIEFRPFLQKIIDNNLEEFILVVENKLFVLKEFVSLTPEQEYNKSKYRTIIQTGPSQAFYFEARTPKSDLSLAVIPAAASYKTYTSQSVVARSNSETPSSVLRLADFYHGLEKHITENNRDSLVAFETMLCSLPTNTPITIKYQASIKNISIWEIFIRKDGNGSHVFQDFIVMALEKGREDFLRVVFEILEDLYVSLLEANEESDNSPFFGIELLESIDFSDLLDDLLRNFYMPKIEKKSDQQEKLEVEVERLYSENEQLQQSLSKRKTQHKALNKAFSKAKDDEKNLQEQHAITLTKHDKLNDFTHKLNQEISRMCAGIYTQLDSVQTEVSISSKQITELNEQHAKQTAAILELIAAGFANQQTQPVNIPVIAPTVKQQTPPRVIPQKAATPIASPVKILAPTKKGATTTAEKISSPVIAIKAPSPVKQAPVVKQPSNNATENTNKTILKTPEKAPQAQPSLAAHQSPNAAKPSSANKKQSITAKETSTSTIPEKKPATLFGGAGALLAGAKKLKKTAETAPPSEPAAAVSDTTTSAKSPSIKRAGEILKNNLKEEQAAVTLSQTEPVKPSSAKKATPKKEDRPKLAIPANMFAVQAKKLKPTETQKFTKKSGGLANDPHANKFLALARANEKPSEEESTWRDSDDEQPKISPTNGKI